MRTTTMTRPGTARLSCKEKPKFIEQYNTPHRSVFCPYKVTPAPLPTIMRNEEIHTP